MGLWRACCWRDCNVDANGILGMIKWQGEEHQGEGLQKGGQKGGQREGEG